MLFQIALATIIQVVGNDKWECCSTMLPYNSRDFTCWLSHCLTYNWTETRECVTCFTRTTRLTMRMWLLLFLQWLQLWVTSFYCLFYFFVLFNYLINPFMSFIFHPLFNHWNRLHYCYLDFISLLGHMRQLKYVMFNFLCFDG